MPSMSCTTNQGTRMTHGEDLKNLAVHYITEREDIADKIKTLIYSSGFEIYHDQGCYFTLGDFMPDYKACDCFLSEILEIVGKK